MRKTAHALLLSLAGLLAANSAWATSANNYYYNAALTVLWNTTNVTWNTSATAAGTAVTWPVPWDPGQSSANTVFYNASFCTTTLGRTGNYLGPSNTTPLELGGINFVTGNCTLRGPGGFYFCGNGGQVNVAGGLTGTISEPIGGTVGIYKQGAGTLVLTGSNSTSGILGNLTGACHLQAGTLVVGNGALGTGPFLMDSPDTSASLQAASNGVVIPNTVLFNNNGAFSGLPPLTFSGTFDFGPGVSSSCALNNQADILVTGPTSSENAGGGASGGLVLSGAGRIVFSNGANAHKGDIVVNGPTVRVINLTGNAGGTGAITLNGSTVTGSGALTGNGFVGTVNVNSFGVIAPGNYPADFTNTANLGVGALNLASGGDYKCIIGAATGSPGINWDRITCQTLNVNSTSNAVFFIDATMVNGTNLGLPPGFNPTNVYDWPIISYVSVSGFAANKFRINCNALPVSSLSVVQNGNNIDLLYSPPTTASTSISGTNGLQGQFFNGPGTSPTPTNNPVQLVRDVNLLNLAWNPDVQPAQEINGDNWSAEWTGLVVPAFTETYTIYVDSDDGSAAYVNGTQIVFDWVAHTSTESSGTVALTAGVPVPIRVAYYNGVAEGSVALLWSSAHQAKQIIPLTNIFLSPYITNQPVSQNVNPGDPVTFTVGAINGTAAGYTSPSNTGLAIPPPTYQWQHNGANLAGATGPSINIASVGNTDLGAYNVIVGNTAGYMLSAAAQLLYLQTISFPNPGDQTFGAPPVGLAATASSGLPVTFRVVSGPASLSGTNLTLTGPGTVFVAADQSGNATYGAASVTNNFTVNGGSLTIGIPVLQADGTIRLNFTGNSNVTYIIQATTNLTPPITWTNLSTNIAGSLGGFRYFDSDATNHGTRFYRTTTP